MEHSARHTVVFTALLCVFFSVIVSAVAYDTTGGASEPAMIILQVTAAGAGAMPTLTLPPELVPTSTTVPRVPGGGG